MGQDGTGNIRAFTGSSRLTREVGRDLTAYLDEMAGVPAMPAAGLPTRSPSHGERSSGRS
jgi:hypothetical protein